MLRLRREGGPQECGRRISKSEKEKQMTAPELKVILDRVVFRDWEPEFTPHGRDFFVFWHGTGFQSEKHFIGFEWKESDIVRAMKNAAMEQVHREALRDFRVVPAEVTV